MTLRRIDDLTAAWLADALGEPVDAFTVTQIGTGQMSDSYRVAITAPRAWSVVLKMAAADDTSRATGAALGLYQREVQFYAEVGPRIGGPIAPAHHMAFDEADHAFCLLIDDAAPARQGDEIAGASRAEAEAAIEALAAIHAPVLGDATLAASAWLNRESPITTELMQTLFAGFLDRYGEQVANEHQLVCRQLVASFGGWLALADEALKGLVHGDYRLDNLLFGEPGAARPVTVVDWQTVSYGDACTDLAYFLGCALSVEDRRAWSDELIAAYHAGLGAGAPSLDAIREGVRRQSFFGVVMAIISPMLVERTERGDAMFMTVLARHAQQVLDLDSLALLPPPAATEPLRPVATDEAPHEPGPDRLFNESWYFDVADEAAGIGAYVRLGAYPNLGRSWYTALVCGPDRPTVAVIDFAAPLPGPDLELKTEPFAAAQSADEPLRRYAVRLTGTGMAHDDPAGLLRGEPGGPVDVAIDLVWETDGTPYQYRITPRYEIPCRVTGTITVGGEEVPISAVGQRDHSWGVRDWWAMDWVWFAAHLDDGTRLHGVDLRIPGAPRLSIGYDQHPDRGIHELGTVDVTEALGAEGLLEHARIRIEPGGYDLELQALGHGPLLLADDDGRQAQFPRSWCRVRASDGRAGTAWIERNRVVS